MAAIVVGGSTGIGFAVARRLAMRGYLVGVCARNKKDLDEAITRISTERAESWQGAQPELWPPVFAHCMDASSRASMQAAIHSVNEYACEFGARVGLPAPALTAAVNCAGIAGDGLLLRQSEDACLATMAASLHSSLWLVQEAAKGGMVRNKRGSIVLMSSIAASTPRAGQTAYASAKAGIEGLVRASSVELGRFGIRVNGIAPGFIDTRMTACSMTVAAQENVRIRTPLRRLGTPEEVASIAEFLLSPHCNVSLPFPVRGCGVDDTGAAFVTGQTLVVDGGLSTSGAV